MFAIELGNQFALNSLKALKKDLKLKFEVLTPKQLESIRDHGCGILVLFSSMFNEKGDLFIENEKGETIALDAERLYNILEPVNEGSKLNIDLAFVNVMNGYKVANVFR